MCNRRSCRLLLTFLCSLWMHLFAPCMTAAHLGSYQVGFCEALAEADLHPDWIAGIYIGAINSAIIAGNPPAERVANLSGFWEEITAANMAKFALI